MDVFLTVTRIIFLICTLFFSVCSIGAKGKEDGDRYVMLSAIFTVALVMLIRIGG